MEGMMMMRARMWRFMMALITAGSLAGGLLVGGVSTASADYGQGAQYQIEISENCNGPTCTTPGGVWLWMELTPASPGAISGSGDYQATDCVHTGAGGLNAAAHESGTVQWWENSNGTLTITGVALVGGKFPVEITVPSAYDHYTQSAQQVFTFEQIPLQLAGLAQVQVAP